MASSFFLSLLDVFLSFVFIVNITGMTLSPCGSDKTVELEETRVDNTITCSGIPDEFVVDWLLTLPTRPASVNVGTCNVGSTTCSNLSAIGYLATRPSANTSVMTINHRTRVEFVRNGTLECKASKAGHPNQRNGCLLDIIYPPSNVTCTVKLNTSASSVIGRCDVTKVYSSRKRYSCQWYSKQGPATETKENVTVAMQTTPTADVSITGENIINVVFTANLPFLHGNATTYRVLILPGGVSQVVGNIEDPCASIPCKQKSTCVNNATDPEGFTCRCPEGFMGRTCNTQTVAVTQSDNSGAIAGGIVGGVLLIAVGVVAVLVIKKKKVFG